MEIKEHKVQREDRDLHQQVLEVHKELKELKGLHPLVHKDLQVHKEQREDRDLHQQVLEVLLVLKVLRVLHRSEHKVL